MRAAQCLVAVLLKGGQQGRSLLRALCVTCDEEPVVSGCQSAGVVGAVEALLITQHLGQSFQGPFRLTGLSQEPAELMTSAQGARMQAENAFLLAQESLQLAEGLVEVAGPGGE